METLKQVHLLVKSNGMTLAGAASKMASERKSVEARVKALNYLKDIRQQLVEIRESL